MNAFAYFETLNSLFVCVCLFADGLRDHFELSSIKPTIFCKFRNFGKNFIFAKSDRRHICHIKILQLGHDLPASVNNSE